MRVIQHFILRALLAAGSPMQEDTLLAAAKSDLKPRPREMEIREAIQKLQGIGYVTSTVTKLDGKFWSLTVEGKTQAEQL